MSTDRLSMQIGTRRAKMRKHFVYNYIPTVLPFCMPALVVGSPLLLFEVVHPQPPPPPSLSNQQLPGKDDDFLPAGEADRSTERNEVLSLSSSFFFLA